MPLPAACAGRGTTPQLDGGADLADRELRKHFGLRGPQLRGWGTLADGHVRDGTLGDGAEGRIFREHLTDPGDEVRQHRRVVGHQVHRVGPEPAGAGEVDVEAPEVAQHLNQGVVVSHRKVRGERVQQVEMSGHSVCR